mmetsp:Transcript_105011/g.297099  ORF Transcript_105011/g.297099 Transcript_105011/m.297099 type:complete len:583 (-) Transcript_105011:71-1819(-)
MRRAGSAPDFNKEPRTPAPAKSPVLSRRRLSSGGLGRAADRQLISVDIRAVIMVYLVNFMDSLGGNISTPILPFYAHEFGSSDAEIGRLYSVFAFVQTVAMPCWGIISDRYGRRRVLLLSLAGAALGALWQGSAGSYASLFAARAFSGFWAGVSAVCQVYIADVVPPELRIDYMGYLMSSTQASILFGPSLGAGLSALGLNVPNLVQGAVSLTVLPIVYFYLPESPEWLRAHPPLVSSPSSQFASPRTADGMSGLRRKISTTRRQNPGVGRWGTGTAVAIYGLVAMACMLAQMSIVSMFAVFAKSAFGLNALRVGFCMTLGAIASIGTNIFISPAVQRRVGDTAASVLGCCLMAAGSWAITLRPLPLCITGLMVAYVGMAISGGANASGTANLTNLQNRSRVMMGVRMMKSAGAMAGPVLAGYYSDADKRLPFAIAFLASGFAAVWQLLTVGLHERVRRLLQGRQAVGLQSALLAEGWQDEYGTPEEIRDLGEFVADLLTTRHYRWVTYNEALKNCLNDFFPELAVTSEEEHRQAYDSLRRMSRQVQSSTWAAMDAQAMLMDDSLVHGSMTMPTYDSDSDDN